MIIVRVELHSAITGKVQELARMHIANDGSGSATVGNYTGKTLRGRSSADLDKGTPQRNGVVRGHARKALHVWHLVAKMLSNMEYGA